MGDHGVQRLEQLLGIGHTQDRQHVRAGDLVPVGGVGQQLLQCPQGIPEAAGGMPGDQRHRARLDVDLLGGGHPADDAGHLLHRRPAEVEAMAAIDHRGEDLLRLGGGQDEDRARRRLLQCLEERVPGLGGQHVGLVQDVDLVATRQRGVGDALSQVPDVIDRVVGRGIHLNHVERGGIGDRDARFAHAAGRDRRSLLAVETGGEDLGRTGLAGPAGADEQVGMMDLPAGDGVGERAHHLLLADHVGERARAVAAVKGRAGRHGDPESSVVMPARRQPPSPDGSRPAPDSSLTAPTAGFQPRRRPLAAERADLPPFSLPAGKWTVHPLSMPYPRRDRRLMTPIRHSRRAWR